METPQMSPLPRSRLLVWLEVYGSFARVVGSVYSWRYTKRKLNVFPLYETFKAPIPFRQKRIARGAHKGTR